MKLARITTALPLKGRRLRLHLDDGRVIERDLTPLLTGPMFEGVRQDDRIFRSVKVEGGTVVWPNGADLCPDVLIWGGPPPEGKLMSPPRKRPRDQNLEDRLIRARSWIVAASALPEGQAQEVFIFLFIALNAMYGKRQYEGDKTRTAQDFEAFIRNVEAMHEADLDAGRATLSIAVFRSRMSIHALVTNFFLRDSYWRRDVRHDDLVRRFEAQYAAADKRLKNGDWKPLLRLVFERTAVLRNQILHGSVTYGPTSRGWESVEQAVAVLRWLVPAFAELMDRHGDVVKWDPLPYPRLGSEMHPERSHLAT